MRIATQTCDSEFRFCLRVADVLAVELELAAALRTKRLPNVYQLDLRVFDSRQSGPRGTADSSWKSLADCAVCHCFACMLRVRAEWFDSLWYPDPRPISAQLIQATIRIRIG